MVKQADRQLSVFALFVAAVTAVLWSLILLLSISRTELFVAIASLFTLVTLLLFESGERIQQSSQRANEAEAGVEKLTQILSTHLGDTWTLHHNVRLPNVPVVRHLLVSEQGVFAINVMNTMTTHHVKGFNWHTRQEQTWRELGYSPSQEVQSGADGLAKWFAESQSRLSVDVRPRIAWMGSGTMLDDESAVPIWQIGEQDVMVADIVSGEMAADHTQINALIKPYAN